MLVRVVWLTAWLRVTARQFPNTLESSLRRTRSRKTVDQLEGMEPESEMSR
jgi:hypothetical protein